MRSFTIVILSLVVYTVSGAAIVSQDELTTESAIDNQETPVNNEAEELLKTIDELLKEINNALHLAYSILHPSGQDGFPGFRPQHFDEDEDDDEAWFEEHKHFSGFRGFGNQKFGGHRFDENE
uniref:Uncharacterized protein n=1 Tax=Tetranychus urticae TaxID=32264 RepID=T1L5M9_TETUR